MFTFSWLISCLLCLWKGWKVSSKRYCTLAELLGRGAGKWRSSADLKQTSTLQTASRTSRTKPTIARRGTKRWGLYTLHDGEKRLPQSPFPVHHKSLLRGGWPSSPQHSRGTATASDSVVHCDMEQVTYMHCHIHVAYKGDSDHLRPQLSLRSWKTWSYKYSTEVSNEHRCKVVHSASALHSSYFCKCINKLITKLYK